MKNEEIERAEQMLIDAMDSLSKKTASSYGTTFAINKVEALSCALLALKSQSVNVIPKNSITQLNG